MSPALYIPLFALLFPQAAIAIGDKDNLFQQDVQITAESLHFKGASLVPAQRLTWRSIDGVTSHAGQWEEVSYVTSCTVENGELVTKRETIGFGTRIDVRTDASVGNGAWIESTITTTGPAPEFMRYAPGCKDLSAWRNVTPKSVSKKEVTAYGVPLELVQGQNVYRITVQRQ